MCTRQRIRISVFVFVIAICYHFCIERLNVNMFSRFAVTYMHRFALKQERLAAALVEALTVATLTE